MIFMEQQSPDHTLRRYAGGRRLFRQIPASPHSRNLINLTLRWQMAIAEKQENPLGVMRAGAKGSRSANFYTLLGRRTPNLRSLRTWSSWPE
jgi:hypothetical protein